MTPRTRLLALSHVLWTTGRVLPVRELREQTGVPVLVDGAQSVGAIPVDAQGLDFLTISGQKWLCGPDATGAPRRRRSGAAARRPAELLLADRLRAETGSFEPADGAARFDPGWVATASARRARRRARAAARLALRARRRAMAARCRELLAPLVGARTRPTRRSSRSAPRTRRRSSRSSPTRASSSATCPAPASSASRAAGGRARTTSTGSSPARSRYSSVGGAQAELLRDRLQRGDDVRDVLVELERRAARRPRRPRRGGRRPRTTAASASS